MLRAFEEFWSAYPRHVGKLAAQKAYQRALTMATPEEILAGVERYKRQKPAYADWCHPRTFLAQGRWMDEDDTASRVAHTASDWTRECQTFHGGACLKRWDHELKMKLHTT